MNGQRWGGFALAALLLGVLMFCSVRADDNVEVDIRIGTIQVRGLLLRTSALVWRLTLPLPLIWQIDRDERCVERERVTSCQRPHSSCRTNRETRGPTSESPRVRSKLQHRLDL